MLSTTHRTSALAAALVLVTAWPASAATADFNVSTSGAGVSLTVLGQPALDLATTSASIDGTPTARSSGVAAAIGGTEVPGTSAAVEITSGSQTDGANCAAPALPAELAAFVTVDGVCSTASAGIGAFPTAKAVSGVGSIGVDASALTGALTALLLDPVSTQLGDVFETVENVVNGDVITALEEACATAEVPIEQVQQVVEDLLGEALEPIVSQLPDNNACTVLAQMVSSAPQLSDVQGALDALVAALLDAIADLASVQVGINATSEVAEANGVLTGTSSFGTVSLELPSLDLLGDVVALAFEGPVGDFLTQLTDLVSGLGADAPAIPDVAATITEVLDTLGLSPLLADPTPLLSLDVVGSQASVAVDTAAAQVTPTAVAGSITATFSSTLATLLGVPESTTVAPGDAVVLAEGTPLESRLAVGAATTTADSATGEAVTVELLRTIEGGVVLNVGQTTASGAANAPVAPAPAPLPSTGGGAVLAALAAIGSGRALRRGR